MADQAHYVKPQNRLIQAIKRALTEQTGSIPYQNNDPLVQPPPSQPVPARLPDSVQPSLPEMNLNETGYLRSMPEAVPPGTRDLMPESDTPRGSLYYWLRRAHERGSQN